MMKRKELDDLDDDLCSFHQCFSSRKSRRLDGNSLLPVIEEEATTIEEQVHCGQDSNNACVDQSNGMLSSEDKAIVPYDGITTRFFKSPIQPALPIVIDPYLIPGLKDYLSGPGHLKKLWDAKDDAAETQSSRTSTDCMAVVPWLSPTKLTTSETTTQASDVSEPMDAEDCEPELMDTEEMHNIDAGEGIAFNSDTNRGFPMWQQQQQPQQNFFSLAVPR